MTFQTGSSTVVYHLDFYSEICCEVCGEVIHNHFDCPDCLSKYAGTSIYGDVNEVLEWNDKFQCEKCGAQFRILKYDIVNQPNAIVEQILPDRAIQSRDRFF